jgi:hypothetical protein
MRKGWIALAVLLALAGCTTPTHGAGSPSVPPASAFWQDVTLPGDARGSEPNVAVSPDDGSVYVDAVTATFTHVWRADASSWRWSDLGFVAKDTGTNDADVTVRPDGSVWVATMWSEVPGTPAYSKAKCTEVSVSRDQGRSWSDNALGCGASPFFDERPWLASDAQTTYLLHYQSVSQGDLPLQDTAPYGLTTTSDGSAWVWKPAVGVATGFVSRLVAHDGAVSFLDFAAQDGGGFVGPTLETTSDGGLTWTSTTIASERNDMRTPGLAMQGGDGVATWITLQKGGGGVLRASFLHAGAWGRPTTLDGNGTNAMAWADVDHGHLVIEWLHADASAPPCQVSNDTVWRLQVDQDGVVRTIPTPIHEGPLYDVIGGGDACKDYDTARSLGDYLSVAAMPDGTAVIPAPVSAPGLKMDEAPVHVLVVPPPR